MISQKVRWLDWNLLLSTLNRSGIFNCTRFNLRGGGEILGDKQSGHINDVDTYTYPC